MKPKEKKEYRVEINSLFIIDVEASSPEEAKRLVKASDYRGSCYDSTGAFFYEPYDWRNAKIEEN